MGFFLKYYMDFLNIKYMYNLGYLNFKIMKFLVCFFFDKWSVNWKFLVCEDGIVLLDIC